MAKREKVLVAWSGGKDSVLALDELQGMGEYEVAALLTTVVQDYDRVSMHGVHRVLIERQAESLGLFLEKVFISKGATDEEYESRMREVLEKYQRVGVSSVVFGDIFLEDVRKYREENLSKIDMKGVFPIWGTDTSEAVDKFIELGYRAVVTSVDCNVLDRKFAGRSFDERFLSELPAGVDRCGENGEFHSFVYDGPMFDKRVLHKKGEIVFREKRFCYCDLIAVEN
ncbi:MAG: diphthine--ammonia ligase [Planctomycetota bacterium]|nr:MAG: diphthine--ammonia ligase [Planctomycetota bacterium]